MVLSIVSGQALGWDRIWQAGLPQHVAESVNGGLYHAVLGGVVGFGQWLVLRRRMPGLRWWTLATLAGGMLGGAMSGPLIWPLIGFLNEHIEPVNGRAQFVLDVAIGLLMIGIAQWLVLKRHFQKAAWWVLASAVGGIIGGALSGMAFPDASNMLDWTVAWSVGWFGGAAVTGVVLVRFVRSAQPARR